MEMPNLEMVSSEELVDELRGRGIASYIAIWLYDPKTSDCYSIEDVHGDKRLLRGVIEDAMEAVLTDEEED